MAKEYNLSLEDALANFDKAYLSNSLTRKRSSLLTGNFPFAAGHPLAISRLPRSKFYCGITNDLTRRASEHNANILVWVKAKDVQSAIELEQKLGERGFDIGSSAGNGASLDTVFIYMYKKVSGITIE